MTDRTAEAAPEWGGDRAGGGGRAGAEKGASTGAEREATVPVASMDVAPELFPADAAGNGETERGGR